ncbi:MAG: hypothetical protein ACK5TR_07170 [Alphaproteobacteria bacterium]|jgi:hypothetical protein|nr:hypothetical protein [Alphaproteobacteria bacterium]
MSSFLKKLYIHIGLGKTGTTSIQASLSQSRPLLKNKGILYPKAGTMGIGNGLAHHGLASCKDSLKETEIYWEILAEQKEYECHSVVLSSELFSIPSDAMKAFCQEFHEVIVLSYVREQVSLIESVYHTHQAMNMTFDSMPLTGEVNYLAGVDCFFENTRILYDFTTILKPWRETFGKEKIKARLYHPRDDTFDVLDDFYHLIDINAMEMLKPTTKLNVSLSPDFSSLLLSMDRAGLFKEAVFGTREMIVEQLILLSDKFRSYGTSSLISAELRKEIVEYYKESNKVFAQEYLTPEEAYILLSSN